MARNSYIGPENISVLTEILNNQPLLLVSSQAELDFLAREEYIIPSQHIGKKDKSFVFTNLKYPNHEEINSIDSTSM